MKVTINLSEMQFLKALAISGCTDSDAESAMAKIRETPEVDITEFCKSDADLNNFVLGIACLVIGTLVK